MPVRPADQLRQAVVHAHRGVLQAAPAEHGTLEHRRPHRRCRRGRRRRAAGRTTIRRAPARAIASASGVRAGDHTASTQWASAFIPVSADTRTGVDGVSSGSYTAATGAHVGPPPPCFVFVAGSVMPKNGVSSAPE